MSLILSIDTSTKVCSVALHQEGKLLTISELFTEKSHS
ncbi:MAG: tRNA (adenosine(37)-N6)-threonylcarbamoyltransferase complex dimerization subunit type 1 TsaB, partial [Arcicella sp.]|nr:tRNA (adenosine(37)-N6)-threonylcarbamoyltransferase complex dimerization subunit type 1 TsaB [Arcicella sp.]